MGTLISKTGRCKRLDAVELKGHPKPDISHSDNCSAMIGLLYLGKSDFEAIEKLRQDPVLKISLGINDISTTHTQRKKGYPGYTKRQKDTPPYFDILGWKAT